MERNQKCRQSAAGIFEERFGGKTEQNMGKLWEKKGSINKDSTFGNEHFIPQILTKC